MATTRSRPRAFALLLAATTVLSLTAGTAPASAAGLTLTEARQAVKAAKVLRAQATQTLAASTAVVPVLQAAQLQAVEDFSGAQYALFEAKSEANDVGETYAESVAAFRVASDAYAKTQATVEPAAALIVTRQVELDDALAAQTRAVTHQNQMGSILRDARNSFDGERNKWPGGCIVQTGPIYCYAHEGDIQGGVPGVEVPLLSTLRDELAAAQNNYDTAQYIAQIAATNSDNAYTALQAAIVAHDVAVTKAAPLLLARDAAAAVQAKAYEVKTKADDKVTAAVLVFTKAQASLPALKSQVAQAQAKIVTDQAALAVAEDDLWRAENRLNRVKYKRKLHRT